MSVTALFVSLLALAAALPAPEPIQLYYHEAVGIQAAERIRQQEQAVDFDGSRIVGGSAAAAGAHPHLAGLVITLAAGGTSVCSASLLSNTRLSTAAHCWFDGRNQARQLVVVLGSALLFTGGTRITTNRVQTHASYNTVNANNDVAIITINRVNFGNNIQRIALATGSNQFVNAWAQAAGFGITRDNTGITNNQNKNHVSLQVITNAVCRNTFGATVIIASTLCTSGAGNVGVCSGDSGGPLAIGSGNNRQLIGISSFVARAGCQRGLPSAFARVTSFASWFQARM